MADVDVLEMDARDLWDDVARLTDKARKAEGRGDLQGATALFRRRDALADKARKARKLAEDARKKAGKFKVKVRGDDSKEDEDTL